MSRLLQFQPGRYAWLAALSLLAGTAPAAADFNLRMQTDLGALDILMLDSVAPLNVANFMNYVNDGDYDYTFIHRMIRTPGSKVTNPPYGTSDVIQGGGFIMDGPADAFFSADGVSQVPRDPPVVNEFNLSNVRGTIAAAKVPERLDNNGDVIPGTGEDSATNGWFFNVADNSSFLDSQNGGFTVFARVQGDGMDVIDAVGALPICPEVAPFFICNSVIAKSYAAEVPLASDLKIDNSTLVNVFFGADNEGDGAIDRLENLGPNGGDGNNDLIMDSMQSHVVSWPGDGVRFSVLESEPTHPFTGFAHRDTTFAHAFPGGAYDLIALSVVNDMIAPGGFASYGINGLEPGGTASVTIRLPTGEKPDTFFMYGPTPSNPVPHWYEFIYDGTTGARFEDNVIKVYFVDGKIGDADLDSTNGVISVAPSGAAEVPVDLDGVSYMIEDAAPNGGDGNNDSILDSLQGHVASLPEVSIPGSPNEPEYVTIEATDSTHRLHYVEVNDGASIKSGLNNNILADYNFENGFFEIHLANITLGGPAEVKITLPADSIPEAYFMFGPEMDNQVQHWYRFDYDGTTGAVINGNVVTLHFVDGQRGDADLTANGIIADPGGPAASITNTFEQSSVNSGCSIGYSHGRPLQAGAWWLIFLMLAISRHTRRLQLNEMRVVRHNSILAVRDYLLDRVHL